MMLTGSSTQMEEQAKALTEAQLTEIAYANDFPPALKARAELARRIAVDGKLTLLWARIAGWTGIAALLVGLAAAFKLF